jgi:hypothetical protein
VADKYEHPTIGQPLTPDSGMLARRLGLRTVEQRAFRSQVSFDCLDATSLSIKPISIKWGWTGTTRTLPVLTASDTQERDTARPLFDVLRAQLCFLHEPRDFLRSRAENGAQRVAVCASERFQSTRLMASGLTRHCREQPNLGDFRCKHVAITLFSGPAARLAIACKAAF